MVAPDAGPNGFPPGPDVEGRADTHSRANLHTAPESPHPLEPLLAHLSELRQHAGHYVQATADSLKLTVRQAALRAVLGCLGLVVGAAVLVTCSVLLLQGVAGGLAEALGGRMWAGQLITGLTVLLLIGLACWLVMRKITASSRRKTIEKYEGKHHDEQARLHRADQRQRTV